MQHKILQEPTLNLGREKIMPYVVYDVAYLFSSTYKECISRDMQRDTYDKALQSGHLKIALSKNRWRIMKNLNSNVLYSRQVILACCVSHNFCKLHEDGLTNFPPMSCKDSNGLDHPRQLENENQSKLQQGGLSRLYLKIGICIL